MKPKASLLAVALLLLSINPGCIVHWLRHSAAKATLTAPLTVPLRLFAGEILVQVLIDGQPAWFFVDTGAPVSTISPKLTEKIAKKRFSAIKIGVGGATDDGSAHRADNKSRLLRFDGLQLGGVTFDDVLAVELDLSSIEAAMGVEISGILGLSFFENFLVTIDYPNQKLIIEEGALPAANQQDIWKYTIQQGHLTIPMKLGTSTVQMVLDSGSNSFLDIPESLEKSVRFQAAPVISGQAMGATGKATQRSARLDGDLLLGRYTVQTPVVSMFKTTEASVGGPLLKNFALTVDQKQKTLRLARADATPITSPPLKTLGASLLKKGDGWEVSALIPAAEGSGLKPGDLILSANDQPTKGFDFSAWAKLVEAEERLRLVVQRGTEQLEITLPVLALVP